MVIQLLDYFPESLLNRTLNSLRHLSAKQKGVALLTALVLMLAIVMVLGNIFYRHQIDVSQASSASLSDQRECPPFLNSQGFACRLNAVRVRLLVGILLALVRLIAH